MRKLKKLFKLIPVFCVAFVSGLSAVLSYDHNLKPVKADSNVLINSYALTNKSITYTSNNSLSITFVADYSMSFYKDVSNGLYSYVVSMSVHPSLTRIVQNGVTFSGFAGDNDYTVSVVFNNILNSGSSIDRQFVLRIGAITNLNYQNTTLGGSSWTQWVDRLGFSLTASDFTISPSVVYAETYTGVVNALILRVNGNMTNVNSNSTNYSSYSLVTSYNVDLSFNNYDYGYEDGYGIGYQDGYNAGYQDGYNLGYENGFTAGSDSREPDIDRAYDNGYSSGYSAGYNEGSTANHTASTIFSGILQVGMLPINIMLAMFNFEILGINLSAFVSALLTVCLTVIVIRTITGKGGNND